MRILLPCLCCAFLLQPADPLHRSPVDLAIVPSGRWVLTANHTADSVSLVDLESGNVLDEKPCGHKPAAVAISPNGRWVAVSNLWSGTLSLFELEGHTLRELGHVAIGPMPRGIAFAPGGQSLFVAVAGADEVVIYDWPSRKIMHRWPAPREPKHLALSADGRLLIAASNRSSQVRCWDTGTRRLLWERKIEDGFNLHGLAFAPDGESVICAHAVRRSFPVSRDNIEQGWVIDNRLTRFAVAADAMPPSWQIALDTHGQAVGDVQSLVFAADRLAVTAAGTHELLLLDPKAIYWNAGEPGDFLDVRLTIGDSPMRRVPLEGRPMTVAPLPNGKGFVVANYLLDAVQIVDATLEKEVRVIPLGGPARPSLARQGEALFYDARRSRHQWFSCHTCHVDGHTCGLNFDTLNDDSYGNPKLTPTVRGVAKTGPWTWHGWQKDLGAAVRKSLTETMFGPPPTADDVRALVAFLETLDHPPNPHRDAAASAVARGEAVFRGKARCARCHKGENFTSESNYDVKLEPDGSPYPKWNPPSLRGLWDRGPFLHDGRASSLEELLDKFHGSEKLDGQPLTPQERNDLLEFLQSL